MSALRLSLLLTLMTIVMMIGVCPPQSTCLQYGYTFECVSILQTYYRYYDEVSRTCPCMSGFIEKQPAQPYCCPFNCTACTDEGCVKCPIYFKQRYSPYLQVYVCECEENYYYDNSTASCICSSQLNSMLYYENTIKDQCLQCPDGCLCNVSGCYSCSIQSLRIVSSYSVNSSLTYTCSCIMPYTDDGTDCFCISACNCTNFTTFTNTTCTATTHRQYRDGHFKCKHPYSQVSGTCQCLPPYMVDTQNTSIDNCVCSSRYYPTKYYEYGIECYRCVQGCICNEKGCIYCDPEVHRNVTHFICPCQDYYFLFNDSCNCTQPYYLRDTTNTTNTANTTNKTRLACSCLSLKYPDKYVWDTFSRICYACPTGCSCNSSGCYACSNDSLRNVTNNNQTTYNCSCMAYTYQINNSCKCEAYAQYVLVNNTGTCACIQNTSIYNDSGKCKLCPVNCTCANNGCILCGSLSNRTPLDNSGYSTCPCNTGYKEDKVGYCVCTPPFQIDVNGTCNCPTPYSMQGNLCLCNNDTTNYYDNKLDNICQKCPVGCTCNVTGCLNCQEYTLRYNVIINNHSECPCIQNSSYYNSQCTICFNSSYYYSGTCVDCPTCLTCNINGCTSCSGNATLKQTNATSNQTNAIQWTCGCPEPLMNNYMGVCLCMSGMYISGGTCQPCPNYCLDCSFTDGSLACISCQQGVHRYNSPATNCPCQQGYIEVGNVQPYCCPDTCLTCNLTQCLACPIYTYRLLNITNITCQCQNNLIEVSDSVVCSCPQRQYIQDGYCVNCPLNCLTCTHIYNEKDDKVICLECQANMNRDIDDTEYCSCLDKFKQSNPVLDYCYPAYCLLPTRLCAECEPPRIVKNGGLLCGCNDGFFLNTYGDCLPCTMEGCVNCTALNLCLICDTANGYYLTDYSCKKIIAPNQNTYLTLQHQDGIHVVVIVNVNLTEFNEMLSINAELEKVIQDSSQTELIADPIVLTIYSYALIPPNVLVVHMSNPTQQLQPYLLELNYVVIKRNTRLLSYWNGSDSKGSYLAFHDTIYFYRSQTYSDQQLNIVISADAYVTYVFTILFMLVALGLYIKGFKHNQTVFFVQTLNFIAFTYNDPNLQILPFLYNLRFSSYYFNKFLVWILPDGYYEASTGNFSLLTEDSNILRVDAIPLLIALLVMLLSLVLRLVYKAYLKHKCMRKPIMHRLVRILKKPIYRLLEFFYKTCMFPILFMSFITFQNWNTIIIAGQSKFRILSQAIAIISVLLYIGDTIFTVFFESISKVYRLENLMEFVTDVIASIIIIYSPYRQIFLLLILVYFLRGFCYLLVRKLYLRDFSNLEYMRGGSVLLETMTLCLIMTKNRNAVASFTFITALFQTAHSIIILILTEKRARRAKRKSESQASETQDRIDIELQSGAAVEEEETGSI